MGLSDRPRVDSPASTRQAKPKARPESTADVASLLKRIDGRLQRDREEAAKARKAIQAQRTKDERTRRNSSARWISARTILLDIVREMDREFSRRGYMLSAADHVWTWPMIGSVEIEIKRTADSHSCGQIDLCVDQSGAQSLRSFGIEPAMRERLPPLGRVTGEDYRALLLRFVERALSKQAPRRWPCLQCGKQMAA